MGTDNNAQEQAEANERERQAAIQSTVDQINSVFNSPGRERQYGDFLGATRQYYTDDLNRKNTINNRNLKFEIARTGQAGGSLAADLGRRAGESYQRGLIESDRLAQGAEASLRQSDQDSRLGLISMAQSGLDATTATQQAASSLRSNIQGRNADARAEGVGDIFGSFADIYRRSQENAAYRRWQRYDYDTTYKAGPYSGYYDGDK